MQTLGDVIDKLQAQGSSRQIADFLEQQEVRGMIQHANQCAIAVYAQRELVTTDEITVGLYGASRVRQPASLLRDVVENLHYDDCRSPVSQFVHDFDAGKYPNLVAR